MYRLTLLFSDPDLRTAERPGAVWFCSGVDAEYWEHGNDWLTDSAKIEDAVIACGDSNIVKITLDEGTPVEVTAWKAMPSFYDVFFRIGREGRVILTDHLRNALVEMPMEERRMSEDAVIDQLLFRGAPGHHAHCEGLERLGPGERLSINLKTGRTKRVLFDKLRDIAQRGTAATYVQRVDAALEKAVAPFRNHGNVVNLFSGGIDSALLQSYLGSDVPALFTRQWNIADYEKDYAGTAARALDIPLNTVHVEHEDYLPLLEAAINKMGQPASLDQIVVFERMYREPGHVFLSGNMADSVFGSVALQSLSMRIGRSLSGLPGARLMAKSLHAASFIPLPQLHRIAKSVEIFRQHPLSPRAYAGLNCAYTDYEFMDRIFGADRISQRLSARLDFAASQLEFSAPENDFAGRHMELAHWLEQATSEANKTFRHLAHAHGKAYKTPFIARAVMDAALSIPVHERYDKDGQSKYLLKRLLKQQAPDYPVNRKKGANLFHVEEMFADGALKSLWDRYPLPDFLTGQEKERFLSRPAIITWSVANLAMWRDLVLRNPDLTHTPDVIRYEA